MSFARGLTFVLAALAAGPLRAQPAPPDPFASPNLLLSGERLRQVRVRIGQGDPLMQAARDQVLAEAGAFLTRPPDPIQGVLEVPGFYTRHRARQQALTRRLRTDAAGAHALALAWALTDDPAWADQAERYLFAWVDALSGARDGQGPWYCLGGGGDTRLVITYSFPAMCFAHDLLRGTGRIDAGEEARFRAWLARFVAYARPEQAWKDNGHAWQCLFLVVAGHALADRALLDEGVSRFRRAFAGALCPDGRLSRELLRGEKAATYSLMALEAMLQLVVVAERHGHAGLRDLQAGGLRRAVDRLGGFVRDPASWRHPLLPARLNGPASPGEWGWLFEAAHALWSDPAHLALASQAPYGVQAPRAYTLACATLAFRPLSGLPPTLSGEPGLLHPLERE